MLTFFTIIIILLVILSVSFIQVTNNTLYHNTWNQLKSYSDSLVQDSIRYDPAKRSFEGFATDSLQSMTQLSSRSMPVMGLLQRSLRTSGVSLRMAKSFARR